MERIYNLRLQGCLEMIGDEKRNLFFKNALNECAKDKVVLDLGSGTGLLSFYALESGAKHVYSVEWSKSLADCTRKILSDNFDSSRFTILELDFRVEDLSNFITEKIDILVTEQVGSNLLDGGNMCDAWTSINKIVSDDFVSIPNQLQIDLIQWDYKLPIINEMYSNQGIFKSNNSLSQKFSKSLLEFDENSNIKVEYYSIFNFNSIKASLPKPDKVHKDCFVLTHEKVNQIFNPLEKPLNLNSKLNFEIQNDFQQTRTFILIPKISFGSQTLILQNCSTWDYNASCFVVHDSDSINFSFVNDIVNLPGCWICSK